VLGTRPEGLGNVSKFQHCAPAPVRLVGLIWPSLTEVMIPNINGI
jgi:hypothetical protein